MVKPQDVDTTNVTDEQIGRCHKVFSGSTPFYMVESEQDSLTEYKVRWSKKHGFTCTCEAGQHGFSNCKDGICKHVKWAVAASREEREAVAELQAAIAEQAAVQPVKSNAPVIDTVTMARIEAANERQAGKVSKARGYQVKGFSLLK